MYIESITPEGIEKLDYASFPGKIVVIDSVGAEFNRAITYLRSQKIIGFDTETRPCFGPNQPRYGVSLLQLSGPEKAFLFRVKDMGMHRRLCNLMSDSRIIKVGAAIHDDIRGLQKLKEFEPRSFVDLQKIVWEY
ncbi:MAG: 3'-5' exonuclease domain-containing protein 2, partial [Bacteroidales bacterium]|nr:3'-5' exonuclease domain-containing protein 2 [Bacteroidales bacterium]